MNVLCTPPAAPLSGVSLTLSGSKSESNRLLILQALFPDLKINNLSTSDDTRYLAQVLSSDAAVLDIGHAGTAMRFGTAYFASQPGRAITLTGSDRMKERPIGVLVDALRDLGASITYLGQEGYPPLAIKGKSLKGGSISVESGVSSQYLTALLLIAPRLKGPLSLHLHGKLTSRPYLEMTVAMLQSLGVDVNWYQSHSPSESLEIITVNPLERLKNHLAYVESDWSSAGYWYSWVAFQETGYQMHLKSFKTDSLQGDSKLASIYKTFGVQTTFKGNTMTLIKTHNELPDEVMIDLTKEPDQAQTVFATCLGLGIDARLTGLHTLKIKETDRIEAMKFVGVRFRESEIITTGSTITLKLDKKKSLNKRVEVETFHDHRMAMAFAPLCCFTEVVIKDAGVVTKSYEVYWDDLKRLNVNVNEI